MIIFIIKSSFLLMIIATVYLSVFRLPKKSLIEEKIKDSAIKREYSLNSSSPRITGTSKERIEQPISLFLNKRVSKKVWIKRFSYGIEDPIEYEDPTNFLTTSGVAYGSSEGGTLQIRIIPPFN